MVWYSLRAVEQSEIIDECILVAAEDEISYVRSEIVEKYGFHKVKTILAGGCERWESVGNAVAALGEESEKEGYVFIHDGARPFLSEEILSRTYEAVRKYGACVAAVPSKDTVKLADEAGFAAFTPDRSRVWIVQTPQVFETGLIVGAYRELQKRALEIGRENIEVTDDASVIESFTDRRVRLTEGSYRNIKVTTPEDMKIAEAFLNSKAQSSFS